MKGLSPVPHVVLAALFAALSGFESVRAAEPGEFTRRAFENGKLDLTEVEGLGDLLAAETDWTHGQRVRVVRALQTSLTDPQAADARQWLARIETAQQAQPRDARLQYLAGMVCLHHQLWGKSQGLLAQAVKGLKDPALLRSAWGALAELAEQRQDAVAAAQAWKQAAQVAGH